MYHLIWLGITLKQCNVILFDQANNGFSLNSFDYLLIEWNNLFYFVFYVCLYKSSFKYFVTLFYKPSPFTGFIIIIIFSSLLSYYFLVHFKQKTIHKIMTFVWFGSKIKSHFKQEQLLTWNDYMNYFKLLYKR